MLAVDALAPEAQLLVQRDRPLVVAEDRQLHAVQAQLLKRELERQLDRLGPVALALARRVADRDAQPGVLVRPQNALQLEVAQQLVAVERPHREQEAAG